MTNTISDKLPNKNKILKWLRFNILRYHPLVFVFSISAGAHAEPDQNTVIPLNAPGREEVTTAPAGHIKKTSLVEVFTANTLNEGESKLGLELNYGLSDSWMIGTDTLSTLAGIPTFYTKYQISEFSGHRFSMSLQGTWLTLDLLAPWSSAKSHYHKLSAKMLRPAFIWSYQVSPRLILHSYWTAGIGSIEAELTDYGKRKSWEQKHPGKDYDQRNNPQSNEPDTTENPSTNQEQDKKEESSNLSRRTLELQSLFGLSTDRFQITGEIQREGGSKILITSMIEKMQLEDLKANSMRFTISQQWKNGNFHFRLGIGVMYLTITGTDLDQEKVDDHGVTPVSDISFYWRF